MFLSAKKSLAQISVKPSVMDSVVTREIINGKVEVLKNTLKLDQVLNPLSKIDSNRVKSKLSVKKISVEGGIQRIGHQNRITYGITGSVSILGFPLDLQFNNNQPDHLFNHPFQGGLFNTRFNKESILQTLSPELNKYKELKSQLLGGKDLTTYLREEAMQGLTSKVKKEQVALDGIYHHLNQHGNIENLLKLEEKELKDKLTALTKEKQASAIVKGNTVVEQQQEELSKKLEPKIDSLVAQFSFIKNQLADQGISPQRLADIEKLVNNKLDLKDYVSKYAASHVNAKGWQKVLGRLNDLQMGSFADLIPGSFMNKDLFLQGGSVAIQTKNGPLQIGLASSKDIGFIKDEGFSSSNFNVSKYLTFLSVPVLGNGFSRGRISWTGSLEQQSYRLNELASVSPRSGSSLTLSQDFGTEKMGRFTLEVSKSASAYRNVGQIGSEHLLLEQNTFGNYFKDDLFETMAFGVKYDLNDQKSRLNTNLFFNYSGIGFQNPAQQGFGNMGMRLGGSIRKGFLKNKIMFNVRGDLKNTPVSGTTDAHWQNHNLNVEARFKLSRKFNFSMKYLDNGVQKSGEIQQAVYGSKKYQFDASSSYRLFKKSGFSHLVMGLQQMNNPMAKTSSQFLTSIYTQSLSLAGITLMANVFYNKELGQANALGDMFNGDASIQYPLLLNMTASTAITYLDNTGQARQLGIKQNAQFVLWKNMEVNLYADIRKNMIKPLYSELFASNRGEVSLKYYFK